MEKRVGSADYSAGLETVSSQKAPQTEPSTPAGAARLDSQCARSKAEGSGRKNIRCINFVNLGHQITSVSMYLGRGVSYQQLIFQQKMMKGCTLLYIKKLKLWGHVCFNFCHEVIIIIILFYLHHYFFM